MRLGIGAEKHAMKESMCPECNGWSYTLYASGICPWPGCDFTTDTYHATVKRADDKDTFGFFKRPTKAEIVGEK
jgi:hypothetical protein